MNKTLSHDDWVKIKSSFDIMQNMFPHASKSEDTPTYKLTSIKGIVEQIEERSIGEVVFYMDYVTGSAPKISKAKIIDNIT